MTVEIITPEKEIFSGTASLIQFPGLDGLFEILENHDSMIAALKKGRIKLVSEGETLFFEIKGGTMEVVKNNVQVLAE